MAYFAVLENNVIINVIVADTKEIAEEVTGQLCVEYFKESPAIIGLGWDEATGFEQPQI